MKVTNVRIEDPEQDETSRIAAYCSVTFDGHFVVHGVKVVRMDGGALGVAMPSRRHRVQCDPCKASVSIFDLFCWRCSGRLPPLSEQQAKITTFDRHGKPRLHHDVCHPLDPQARAEIEAAVLAGYRSFRDRSATGVSSVTVGAPAPKEAAG